MKNINSTNTQLGYYIAGLIEGDGNIWTSQRLKSIKGRVNNPQISFTFHKNELPFYELLKETIGENTGSIRTLKSTNTCRYTISDKDILIKTINLINGKFRTPKIKYLYRAIDHINAIHNVNIQKLPLDKSDLSSNAWVSGFADADGNFIISLEGVYGLNNSLSRGRVKCCFSIKQRVIDKPTGDNCIAFFREVADLFQCNINFKAKNEMVFCAQSDKNHHLTTCYFDKHPLMTSKYHNYLHFVEGLSYLGRRLTLEEILEVCFIKNGMNNKRTFFNWDHLKNFYK